MSLALALALQAAAPMLDDPAAAEFDLKGFASEPESQLGISPLGRCVRDDPDDILVCGSRSRGQGYRIQPLPEIYGAGPPLVAETGLFGKVKGLIRVESVAMPDGQISKRIIIGIKIPF